MQRVIFLQIYWLQNSVYQIADCFGYSESKVKPTLTMDGVEIRNVDFLYFNEDEARWYDENGSIDDADAQARISLHPRKSMPSMKESKYCR